MVYRIINVEHYTGRNIQIQKKGFLWQWWTMKEWGGCDCLGFDYGDYPVLFSTLEDAEKYIEKDKLINQAPKIIKEL